MIEELVTIQDSFLLVLDAANADTYNNGSKKKFMQFLFRRTNKKKIRSITDDM